MNPAAIQTVAGLPRLLREFAETCRTWKPVENIDPANEPDEVMRWIREDDFKSDPHPYATSFERATRLYYYTIRERLTCRPGDVGQEFERRYKETVEYLKNWATRMSDNPEVNRALLDLLALKPLTFFCQTIADEIEAQETAKLPETPPIEPAKATAPQGNGGNAAPRDEGPSAPEPYVFGPGFRCARWYGEKYSFTDTQAPVVEILAQAYEAGTPDVDAPLLVGDGAFTQDKIKAKRGKPSAAHRLRDLFRNNPAWGTMIVPGGTRGTYRLKKPDSANL